MAGRKSEKGIINELEFEGKKLTDPTEIAEGFNKFSAEIGPKLSENISSNIEDIDTSGAPNDNFRKNICSEGDLRSRIFGTFVVKFLACIPLLGFSNK